jgi:hypothetical protein
MIPMWNESFKKTGFDEPLTNADRGIHFVRPTRPPRLSESDGGQAWPNKKCKSFAKEKIADRPED